MRGCAHRQKEREKEREWVAGCAFSIVRWLNSLISQIPGWTIRRPRWGWCGCAATTHDSLCYAWSITLFSFSLSLGTRKNVSFYFVLLLSLFFLIAWSHLWYVRYFFLFPPEIRRNFVREKVDIKNVILGERECEFLRLGVPLLRQIVVVIIFIRGEIVAYFENLAEGENLW